MENQKHICCYFILNNVKFSSQNDQNDTTLLFWVEALNVIGFILTVLSAYANFYDLSVNAFLFKIDYKINDIAKTNRINFWRKTS